MSYLLRLAARAGRLADPAPLARPKGLPSQLARLHEPGDEDTARTLHRAEADAPEDEMAPLRRAGAADDDEDEAAAPLRRSVVASGEDGEQEEAVQPLNRAIPPQEDDTDALAPLLRVTSPGDDEQEDALNRAATPVGDEDEPLAALRRAAGPQEQEEAMQALARRVAPGREEDEMTAAPLRRVAPTPDSGLDPETAPKPPELDGQPERPALRGLRRDTAPFATGSGGPGEAAQAAEPPTGPRSDNGAGLQVPPPAWADDGSGWRKDSWPDRVDGASAARPQVVIEHLDVVVREPAGLPAGGAAPRPGAASRGLRARYLGGL